MKMSSYKISNKIELNLNRFYYKIVQAFQQKYIQYFNLLEYFFSHNLNHPTLSLYIKFQLNKINLHNTEKSMNNLVNKSILFSLNYSYKRSNQKYIISWKFDLRQSNETHTWIFSESQEVFFILKNLV